MHCEATGGIHASPALAPLMTLVSTGPLKKFIKHQAL
jgi:hypothetical protein